MRKGGTEDTCIRRLHSPQRPALETGKHRALRETETDYSSKHREETLCSTNCNNTFTESKLFVLDTLELRQERDHLNKQHTKTHRCQFRPDSAPGGFLSPTGRTDVEQDTIYTLNGSWAILSISMLNC